MRLKLYNKIMETCGSLDLARALGERFGRGGQNLPLSIQKPVVLHSPL